MYQLANAVTEWVTKWDAASTWGRRKVFAGHDKYATTSTTRQKDTHAPPPLEANILNKVQRSNPERSY